MSTADDASKHAPGTGAAADRADGAGGAIIFAFVIGLAASLIVGWVVFPKLLYSQKRQPIDFNHALHLGLEDQSCESCHFFREDGSFSGAPALAQCIGCHAEVQGDSPDEIRFVEEYVQKGREVPWLIYSRQPQCVYFSHVAHVRAGGMDCVSCHGHIGESERLPVYEENRISGYSRNLWGHNIAGFKKDSWDRMKMDDCAECHAREGVTQASVQTTKEGCFVCHK